jgi:hypothetical protein
MTLSEFFYNQTKNGLTFGWFGTEIIWDTRNEERIFNRFRPVDSGTIYFPQRKDESEYASIRESAIQALKEVKAINVDIDFKNLEEDKFAYVQVVTGIPRQAFTSEELVMTNLFPSTDLEHNGYPLSPMDTTLSAITTHISIDTYNKLYFQNGRAAKGMLVIKSTEIDQTTVDMMKTEFYASINGVGNSFRTPIFAVDPEDDVKWEPMVSNAGDGEFQFLYDNVARTILSAFSMSPDELPGMGHLSRGTNQATLS